MPSVRWYEVLENENLPLDEINTALECARLRWQQTCARRGHLTSAAEYGLLPLGPVRGLVHIVWRDFAVDNLLSQIHENENEKSYVNGNWDGSQTFST